MTIVQQRKTLVEAIRAQAKADKALWQQVPYLALMADGRTGFLDNYARAYLTGYWALTPTISSGHYLAYVDLATGEIVNAYRPTSRAADDAVLAIANDPASIDAGKIVAALKRQAKEPIHRTYPASHAEELAARQREIIREQRLKPVFTRRRG